MQTYLKGIHTVLLLPLIMLFAGGVSSAQGIKGNVVDDASGQPLSGVSVYLNGTYKGTSSDSKGDFFINSSELSIPLIVSYLGYETQTINDYAGKNLTIRLIHKANILKEVTIGFGGMSREDEMKIFLQDFIGVENRDCIITNPDDISFSYHKKTKLLTASSEQPLIIHNNKLGYKLTYFLMLFRHLPNGLSFQGNYFFAEDTAGRKVKEIKKVINAREDVYLGSRMHFIRALWSNKLREEKFHVSVDTALHYDDLVSNYGDKKMLKYHNFVRIDYKVQRSFLKQPEPDQETFIAANGFYEPNIIWGGDIALQRIGELLPFEYELPQKK